MQRGLVQLAVEEVAETEGGGMEKVGAKGEDARGTI